MTLLVEPIPVGAKIVDTVENWNEATLSAWVAAGVQGLAVYLEQMTDARVAMLFAAGLGMVPTSFSRKAGWMPSAATGLETADFQLERMVELALPIEGVCLWHDLEGCAKDARSDQTLDDLDNYGKPIAGAGAIPSLYVGADQPLDSNALFRVAMIHRYWKSMSRVPEPQCGFTLVQFAPTTILAGVPVDMNMHGHDFFGRAATWIKQAA